MSKDASTVINALRQLAAAEASSAPPEGAPKKIPESLRLALSEDFIGPYIRCMIVPNLVRDIPSPQGDCRSAVPRAVRGVRWAVHQVCACFKYLLLNVLGPSVQQWNMVLSWTSCLGRAMQFLTWLLCIS